MKRLFIGALALLLIGCRTSVKRVETDKSVDLSGGWNDTDSRLVAEEMVSDALAQGWLDQYVASEGAQPVVIVGPVTNLSHEHINVRTFVNDMQRELVSSGRVEFVAGGLQRSAVRDERKDQDLNAREETRNPMGEEIGADFMLTGEINTIVDLEKNKQVRYYQVDLILVNMLDNRKVWYGQKKIKKVVKNSSLRY